MDSTLQFDYPFHHGHHPAYYPSCGSDSIEDSGSAKDGPPLLPFGLPSDPTPAQFARGGCSYLPLDLSQEHMHGTYWAGPELCQGPPDVLRLHAPIPVSGCAPILRSNSCCPEDYTISELRPTIPHLPVQHSTGFQPEYSQMQRYDDHTGVPCLPSSDVTMPQSTFPTPSELLVELYTQENHSQQASHPGFRQERYPSTHMMSKPHRPLPTRSTRNVIEPVPDASLLASTDSTSESITSHEKKRHYLECLEHYVGFLHDHFRHNGIKPASLERISNYRCLSSRSIRSLLIHMEKTTKQMKEQIFREEQKFLRLRQALQQREDGLEVVQSSADNLTADK